MPQRVAKSRQHRWVGARGYTRERRLAQRALPAWVGTSRRAGWRACNCLAGQVVRSGGDAREGHDGSAGRQALAGVDSAHHRVRHIRADQEVPQGPPVIPPQGLGVLVRWRQQPSRESSG
eukprot:scaffold14838_cov101-Isochrysis_galbana.AAC.3